MEYKIDFNHGLGVLPVSLFIKIDEKPLIFDMWDKIKEYNCADIIFYGDIWKYVKELNFLTSTLHTNMHHTTILVLDLNNEMQLEIMAGRLVVFFKSNRQNATYFKHRIQLLKNLTEKDVIILNPTSVKDFLFTRQILINKEIKAKIMLDTNAEIGYLDLLDNKVYDIYLYNGKSYV